MPWWSRKPEGEESSPVHADAQTTQDVLASIFAPANRAMASCTTDIGGNGVIGAASSSNDVVTASAKARSSAEPHEETPPILASRNGDMNTREGPAPWWVSLGRRQSSTPIPRSDDASGPESGRFSPAAGVNTECTALPAHNAVAGATNATAAVSWQNLPKCPLAGYELTCHGLVDKLRKPPHTLTVTELRYLIKELTVLEQQAKYNVDRQFTSHMGNRSLHGLKLLISPALMLTSIYLMAWKTTRLYHNAVPQNSVFFTQLLALLRLRMPVEQRELVAQRHRRLMRATNARVSLSFLSGVGLFTLACLSWPSAHVMQDAPDMKTAKELIAYQQHSAALLKWCWFVYYHHPAYSLSSGECG
ncbi:hypothetical protein JKF63_05677 [Porcisia hertigi]|uniref:Uncharacterized protein n=1 Tax=Porcisia hertigi TaxID=2761500 RepID=A0A836IE70_9TRYP|nr:hypothetical protein JKF63_05677 [Porcisia hertigi]